MLNGSDVLIIMARTLGIAIALDVAARYLMIVSIPWYATTAVLTLFMYACESSAGTVTRGAIIERFTKLEDDVTELRKKLVAVEAEATNGTKFDPLWEEVKALWNKIDTLREMAGLSRRDQ